ncbi:acyl-CoA dehydrogenase family protein [Micromonospora sp. C95]|uniref:acyl-CoA dehydrogenase family protein n=1 Tax=Micromonospora sp. C95 TaxID=2824882 RepID=UPI001B365405|nr:acyl-CoA dehydrogenase [Micromonospora sp. C95]MBQ1026049.1 acyl-CoA dehydrogenase [Micromonospora sp. C95]
MNRTEPERLDALRVALGDPAEADNPVGNAAALAVDERGEAFVAGERLLDAFGFPAEFVPAHLGGRLTRLDHMIHIARTVGRRDLALAFGYSGSTFIASTNVWTAGSPAQQRAVADLVLGGGRVAAGYHELAHGNDVARAELSARRAGDTLVLDGRKEVISNLARADLLVLYARTGTPLGPRSHSLLLVDLTAATGDTALRLLPRFRSAGMRSVQLGGIEFDGYRLPAGHVLGRFGDGVLTATRAFQVTRTALPAIACAGLDGALREAMSLATSRHLGRGVIADLPQVRRLLVDAFVDLLVCDAFTTVGARALHLLPQQTTIVSSAIKYLVPHLLLRAVRSLSTLLGSTFYVRNGRHGMFQKHLRDLAPAGFGHMAPKASLAMLVPQMQQLVRRGWSTPEPADPLLFRLSHDLPDLRYHQLAMSSNGRDALGGTLLAESDAILAAAAGDAELRRVIGAHLADFAALRRTVADLPAGRNGPLPASSYDLADRYSRLLAASACIGVWRGSDGRSFLGSPQWLTAALSRLTVQYRPGRDVDQRTASLWPELHSRHVAMRTFDLAEHAA